MSEPQCKIIVIPNEFRGKRLDSTLVAIIPEISRNRLTNWIKSGAILVNDNIAKPSDKIVGGETVTVSPPQTQEVWNEADTNIPLDIVYADEQIIIINKPANLTVHPGAGNYSGTLLNALLHYFPELHSLPRAGIVHRLDKDTTGLMVVARTLESQNSLVKQLQARSVSRVYHAIVEGLAPKKGTINKNIGRHPRERTKMTALDFGGKEAITNYQVLEYYPQFSYIECRLETGRTHQIRVHLKSIGHPIVGDPVYGKPKLNYNSSILTAIKKLNRQALHAYQLSLVHPSTGKTMTWTAELPDDIKQLIKSICGIMPSQESQEKN